MIKDKFADELQYAVDGIPSSDLLIILGNFNAQTGKRSDDNVWRGVCGKHGVGSCNEAGEKFLEFCAVNNFTIMNTWFKPIHLATWQHPTTKQGHMIDYVVMRA